MPRVPHITALLIAAQLSTAAAQQAAPPRTVTRTSGDTTIARTTGDVADAQLRKLVPVWRAKPDLEDNGAGIGDIRYMAVGPDGRVYVWDPTTPALWMLDANGTTLKRISRRGAGPGEYAQQTNGMTVASDGKLKLWDEGNARINIYEPDGRFSSSHALGFSFCCPGGALTADNQNRLWLRTAMSAQNTDKNKAGAAPPSIVEEVTIYQRTNALGFIVDTVITKKLPGNTPAVTAVRNIGGGTRMSSSIVQYSTSMLYAVSPLGHVVFAQTRPYTVHSTFNGKPLRIERDWTAVPVSSDERAQIRARTEFNMHSVDPDWQWTGADVPAEKPAMSNISVGQDGRIWVTLHVPSEKFTPEPPAATATGPQPPPVTYRIKERRWDVFEPDGRYVGRVAAPRSFGLYVMKGDFVWGIERDADDVPTIVKMRIQP